MSYFAEGMWNCIEEYMSYRKTKEWSKRCIPELEHQDVWVAGLAETLEVLQIEHNQRTGRWLRFSDRMAYRTAIKLLSLKVG